MSDVERQFDAAMYRVWQRAKDECNYNARYFLGMLEEMGGVATAKSLLAKSTLSSGYTELWLRGRLDITVECVVLSKAFRSLFSEQELATARRRLIESNFDPSECEQ